MGQEIITFGDIKVEKQKFHQRKNLVLVYDVNIGRIVVSKKFPFGKKGFQYFIGYENHNEKVIPSCIMLPINMSLLIKDNKLLEKI